MTNLNWQIGSCTTIPLVVTTQEDKGTVYVMIHVDKHPQLFIDNKCPFDIFVGQANEESGIASLFHPLYHHYFSLKFYLILFDFFN